MFTSSSHCDVFQPHYDEYDDERKPSMIAISNEKYIGKLDRDVVFDTTQACKTIASIDAMQACKTIASIDATQACKTIASIDATQACKTTAMNDISYDANDDNFNPITPVVSLSSFLSNSEFYPLRLFSCSR